MFFIKKVYCRGFQLVMRAALPLLPYRSPKVLSHLEEIAGECEKLGVKSVLMTTDASIRSHGLTKPLEEAFAAQGIQCHVYDRVMANPTTDCVEEAVKEYKAHECGALVGFGGGSSIDTAKAVGARIARPKKSLSRMSGILKVRRRIPPLFAVPTTAGTGSECTVAAVITDSKTRHKYPINDFPLIPRYAVLDPQVTKTLPASLTASTGMDALTHAVEAYIGRSTTAETRQEAREAVRLVFGNVERAYQNGEDMQAREAMLRASFLAGDAFSKSYVGYVHAIAHALGGCYNIPHGLANAVLLPTLLDGYGECAAAKLHELAVVAGVSSPEESDSLGAERFITAIRAMNARMGIPTTLRGIREEDIGRLAKLADAEANPLYPVPCLWSASQLERFFYLVMEEKREIRVGRVALAEL